MKIKFLFVSFFFLVMGAFSQEDPKARAILDEVSGQIKSYHSFKASYEFHYHDIKTGDESLDRGEILIKENKYQIKQNGVEIYYNGTSLWTYTASKNECTVISPTTEGSGGVFDFTNPRTLFYFHRDDFKYNYVDSEEIEGISYHVIDLYPVDFSKSEYSRIRLRVNSGTNHIYTLKVFGKEGIHYSFTIQDIIGHIDLSDGQFTFREQKYPNVEIIDLRF
jgi:outer membrane lipoprotein carrier protein